jgi:ion channel-forming bestrophin family protein
MAEDGGAPPAAVTAAGGHGLGDTTTVHHELHKRKSKDEDLTLEHSRSPMSPTVPSTPNPFSRRNTSLDLDDYFTGPRDIQKHSKWPLFLQMHGSILPKLILPLLWVGIWASAITVISKKVWWLGIDSVLLTITGFVVGLGLSFRSSTAYERYNEGRRYWAQLALASQTLARVVWIHGSEPAGKDPKEILLRKVSTLNLILAFAVSLKHRLRFEPYTAYHDLEHLIGHLDTLAREATKEDPSRALPPKTNFFKDTGNYLGVSFAASNPRKTLKKADKPLGNLPLEILAHLAVAVDTMIEEGQLKVPMQQTLAYNNLAAMNDVLTGTERVLNTPLPIAYTIAISQITWVYVMLLPFQILRLDWVTIPAAVGAAYIILGILFIGREIENPFGTDVNDLPLESFCDQIASELDVTASVDRRRVVASFQSSANLPLYPISMATYPMWMMRSEDRIRETIRTKPAVTFESRKFLEDDQDGKKKAQLKEKQKEARQANGDHNV